MRQFNRDPAVIKSLSPEQYRVTQQGATEMPGSGEYLHNDEPGIYATTTPNVPQLRGLFGYAIVIGVMAAICVGLYVRFKRSKWL